MKMKLLLCLIFAFASISCETVEIKEKKFSCSELDWFEIGRSDGLQGLNSMAYESKKTNCESFSDLEHEKYVNGWYSGVDQFCTSQQGFAYGRTGRKYYNICPTGKEAPFMKSYRQGLKVYLYEKDNQKITDELAKIANQAQKVEGEEASTLVKKMNELETRLELNKALISKIQNQIDENLSQSTTF